MPPHSDIETDYRFPAHNVDTVQQYRIRAMNEADLDIVFKIDLDTWGDEGWSWQNFDDSLRDLSFNCWILEDTTAHQSIVGYGLQHMSDSTSHITNLTLRPDQCGRGLGGLLLRHMIDHADRDFVNSVILEVHIVNARAFNLYLKHGFAIVAFLDHYYANGDDAYRMQLLF